MIANSNWKGRLKIVYNTLVRKAVFLDRDKTIIEDDEGYFHDPATIVFVPGAVEALKALQKAGFALVVVTNQSGIGRSYFPESDTIAVHATMSRLLEEQGVHIEKIYYCPHTPDDDCDCRKPKPGLIFEAAAELELDLDNSFFIGDHGKDIEAARNAEVTGILINPNSPDFTAALKIILNHA